MIVPPVLLSLHFRQETFFVTLWGRAFASSNSPDLLDDQESLRIVNETEYDFGKISDSKEYYNLSSAVRAANFDRENKEYLTQYPEARIVSIGSGLDTTFFRGDNRKLFWYDPDLTKIMELRRNYIGFNGRFMRSHNPVLNIAGWMRLIAQKDFCLHT